MASLMPASKKGIDEGSETFQNICRRDAPKQRAASTSCRSVARSPASVLMIIGKTELMTTTMTFDQMSMPAQRMISGDIAIVGVA